MARLTTFQAGMIFIGTVLSIVCFVWLLSLPKIQTREWKCINSTIKETCSAESLGITGDCDIIETIEKDRALLGNQPEYDYIYSRNKTTICNLEAYVRTPK